MIYLAYVGVKNARSNNTITYMVICLQVYSATHGVHGILVGVNSNSSPVDKSYFK